MGNKSNTERRYRNACGPQIKRLRVGLGWTQEKLATQLQLAGLDLSRIDVAKIEGRWRSIYDYELFLFAHTLKIDPKELSPGIPTLTKTLPTLRRGFV